MHDVGQLPAQIVVLHILLDIFIFNCRLHHGVWSLSEVTLYVNIFESVAKPPWVAMQDPENGTNHRRG